MHYLIPDFLLAILPILFWQVIPFLLDASVVATFRLICGLLLDTTLRYTMMIYDVPLVR